MDKWWFAFYHGMYSLAETFAWLYFGIVPWIWYSLPSWMPQPLAAWMEDEIVHTIVFALATGLISMVMELPWNLYMTFVIEERHGFNKQTIGERLPRTVVHEYVSAAELAK